MNYPINDSELIYDYKKHRYLLTQYYIQSVLGVNLESQIGSNGGTTATVIINTLLDNISSEVYNYVYAHNNTQTLQYIIAKSASAREVIKEAMSKQALYVFYSGDLGFSTIKEEKDLALNRYAKEIIDNQEIAETGTTLIYTGKYWFKTPDYEEGNY